MSIQRTPLLRSSIRHELVWKAHASCNLTDHSFPLVLGILPPSRSLSSELLSLLHDLVAEEATAGAESAGETNNGRVKSCSSWQQEIATVLCGWLCRAGSVVGSLQNEKWLEEHNLWAEAEQARKERPAASKGRKDVQRRLPVNRNLHPVEKRDADKDPWEESVPHISHPTADKTPPLGVEAAAALSVVDLDRVVAALCVLGGQVEDIYPGARVLCRPRRGEDGFDALSGWEERPTVEATVLRLAFCGAKPAMEEASDSGDPPANDYPASAQGDSTTEVQYHDQRQHQHAVAMQAARPVFSSRLLPRPPGCARPLDIYQGLTHGAFPSRTATSAGADAVIGGHSGHERSQLQELEQELRRRQQLLMQNARLGSISSRDGSSGGRVDISRELSPPAVRAPTGSVAAMDGGHFGRSAAASTPQERQQQERSGSEHNSLVTVGVAREGQEAPRVVTVRTDEATPVRRGVPRAFTKTLALRVKDFLPGLKAMLEADTAFRGACFRGLFRYNLPSVNLSCGTECANVRLAKGGRGRCTRRVLIPTRDRCELSRLRRLKAGTFKKFHV